MTDLNRKFGRTEFPAPPTGETTLASTDPARDILLELLATALVSDLAVRWQDAAAGTPLADTDPVQNKHPNEPDLAYLREVKTSFPALFVYRRGQAQFAEQGLWQTQLVQPWGVDYILGPLDAGNRRKLTDVLAAAAKLISQVIARGGHPVFGMDSNNVQPLQVLGSATNGTVEVCGFKSIRVVDMQMGPARFSEDAPVYYALSLSLETVEQDDWVDPTAGTVPVAVDWGYGINDPDVDPLPDLVEESSDVEEVSG